MTPVLSEAKRLYDLGFAIIWLLPRSKRPVESGWTTGPRTTWAELLASYKEGYNVGVRCGTPSKLKNGYLTCIDLDIKDPKFREIAVAKLKEVVGKAVLPAVKSGGGNGNRHLYCVTEKPFKMMTVAKVKDKWELCIYSDGRQMVLPPSVHPETGDPYLWVKEGEIPLMTFEKYKAGAAGLNGNGKHHGDVGKDVGKDVAAGDPEGSEGEALGTGERNETETLNFIPAKVEVDWLPISDRVRKGILTGEGVSDRSGFMLQASSALISAGLDQNEVLSVLTDPKTYLGKVGYDHAKTTDRARAAAWVYRYTVKKVAQERSAEHVFAKASKPAAAKELTAAEIEAQNEELIEDSKWYMRIERGGQNGDGAPKSTIENVVLVLTNAIAKDIFKKDTFCGREAYGVDTAWGGKVGDLFNDDDSAKIRLWLGENFGFEPKKETIYDAMTNIAHRNSFDPVRDQIDALPEWDKVERLGGWLKENFEAEGDEEYLDQVFTKWICAMIMRVYWPGTKFDWMPIFEGKQNIGKSSFGKILCGEKYFLDWLPNLADKDAAAALQGIWIVEMGELSQFRKSDLEAIKAYITRTIDKFRPAYGRSAIEWARRCVFFGTTNREQYLRDDTGNRRFKPVKVGRLNFTALRRDRLQLFAEAKYLIESGIENERTLELSGDAKIYEAKIHDEKMVDDEANPMFEKIQIFVKKWEENPEFYPDFDPTKFRMIDLFGGIGPLQKWRLDGRSLQFAAKALKMAGGQRWKSHGTVYWKLTEIEGKPIKGDRFSFLPIPENTDIKFN